MSALGMEIKEKIDTNNKIIEQILTPNQFSLNNTIASLLIENDSLQQQCPHEFVEGYCIYCYKEKPNEN